MQPTNLLKEIRLDSRIYKYTLIAIGLCLVILLAVFGGASGFSLLGRVLFVLFLPGFAILQAITSRDFSTLEKLVLSPITGMVYTMLTSLYLSTLGMPINDVSIFVSVLSVSIPLLAYSWRKGRLIFTFKSAYVAPSHLVLVALLIISIVLLMLPLPKNGIFLPMGDDSATSSLAATLISEQGKIPLSWAPYYPEQNQFSFSPGYPSIIAFLYLLDPSLSIPFLVAFFSGFFAIIHCEVFIVVRRVSNDVRIALLAVVFSVFASAGFYQMMIYGRFPALVGVVLTLGLLLFSHIYLVRGNRKMIILAAAMLAGLFLTYTVSFITAFFCLALLFTVALIVYPNRKHSLFGGILIASLGVALSLPWFLNVLSRLAIQVPMKEQQALILWFAHTSLKNFVFQGNLFLYYGYWFILFTLTGVLVYHIRNRAGSLILAWFLSIVLLMFNEFPKIQFSGWYYLQSGAFLNPQLSFPFVLMAGFGFVKLYDLLKNKLPSTRYSIKKIVPHLIVTVLLITTFYFSSNPLIANASLQINRIDAADYNAIMWLANNTPDDSIIFNDHWVGTASEWIPALAHRRIIMPLLSISEVGWTNTTFTRQNESFTIARSPCSNETLAILKCYNVSYIFLSNKYSDQVQQWRTMYDPQLFLESPHYEKAFNQENAWILKVKY